MYVKGNTEGQRERTPGKGADRCQSAHELMHRGRDCRMWRGVDEHASRQVTEWWWDYFTRAYSQRVEDNEKTTLQQRKHSDNTNQALKQLCNNNNINNNNNNTIWLPLSDRCNVQYNSFIVISNFVLCCYYLHLFAAKGLLPQNYLHFWVIMFCKENLVCDFPHIPSFIAALHGYSHFIYVCES